MQPVQFAFEVFCVLVSVPLATIAGNETQQNLERIHLWEQMICLFVTSFHSFLCDDLETSRTKQTSSSV
jgi:hypothetical protein